MFAARSIQVGERGDFVFRSTTSFLEGELQGRDLDSVVAGLSAAPSLLGENRCCVLYGGGSRTRAAYGAIRSDSGLGVIWSGSMLPSWAGLLNVLVAAQGGFVEVKSRDSFSSAVKNLSTLALIEAYSFDRTLLDGIKSYILNNRRKSRIGPLIGADSSYFCLGVDGDCAATKTGILGWASFGKDCPIDLIEAVQTQDRIK